MKKIIRLIIVASVLGIPGVARANDVQSQKAKKEPSAQGIGEYQFIPFVASNKNMWQHGILLDAKTGRSWLIVSESSGSDNKADTVVAISVQFQLHSTDPDKELFSAYTPNDADYIAAQIWQQNVEKAKAAAQKKQ